MRYVAAYLLSGLGGNEDPTYADIEAIIESVGIEINKEKLNRVLKEMKGKSIEQVISAGKEKLATLTATPLAATGTGTDPAPDDVEQTKQPATEQKQEETEESDDDLGFGLFD